MSIEYAAIVIIILIAIVIYWKMGNARSEDFTNVQEKAQQLGGWLNKNPTASYVDFVAANPESNIVEYTRLKSLKTPIAISQASESLKIIK